MKVDHVFKMIFYAALVMTTGLMSACAAPETLIDHSPVHAERPIKQQDAQLMIKFAAVLSESQVGHKLVAMSGQYHVEFRLIHAMSGGAYVITVKGVADAPQLARLLNAMGQRSDVIYVEQDRVMQHF